MNRRVSRILRKLYAFLHVGLIDLDSHTLLRRVTQLELVAFAGIIIFSWANEVLDLPHRLGLAPATPTNYYEAAIETLWALFVLTLMLISTRALLKHFRYLEGFLPVCSYCKRIRIEDGTWVSIERYMHENTAVKMTHSLCPPCAKKHYDYDENDEA